jgi:hypothetical protein
MDIKRIAVGVVTTSFAAGALVAGLTAGPNAVVHDMQKNPVVHDMTDSGSQKGAAGASVITAKGGSGVVHDM